MPGRRAKAARPKTRAKTKATKTTSTKKPRPAPAAAPAHCELCGEPSTTRRHASPSECFVALRQAIDAAREDLTLARGASAIAAHRADTFHAALRQIADLLRPAHSPRALPGVLARARALVAPHAGP